MVRSMGLIVVGRLAARHGISVRLRTTDGGGITATVVLPASVLLGQPKPPPAPEWRIPPKSITARGTQPSMPAVRHPHPPVPPIIEDSPFHQTHGTGTLGQSAPAKGMSLSDAVKMRRYQRGLGRGENDQN
jgi:hypothetical protein